MDGAELWRATLHDLNNLLAGFQGVLELSDPKLPLDPQNRARLEASLEDGKTLIAMGRALALGRYPDAGMAPWKEWQAGLEERLGPMATLFRCRIQVVDAGASGAPWPAPIQQDWAAAFTRQILPWAAPGTLSIEASAGPDHWSLLWLTDAPIPAALQADPPAGLSRNLPALWLVDVAGREGIAIEQTPRGLLARLGRPAVT